MDTWPKLNLERLTDSGMCFGCGKSNPIGLKLKFDWDENCHTVKAAFAPGENLQGWAGFVHGGVTACVLDEAVGWAAVYAGTSNITAKIQIRYRKMIPIKKTYTVLGTVTKHTSRLIETEAKILDDDGIVYAESTSTQFVVSSLEENHNPHD